MQATSAQRRYNRRILILSAIYAALLFPAVYLFARHLVSGPLALVLGILPALPVIGFFVTAGLYLVEESDEYLRLLFARQSLVATGLAMSAATLWGFLENFDLVPHMVAYGWAILWFVGFGVGAAVNRFIERRPA